MYGPIKGRCHDCTLYAESQLDEMLPNVLDVDGVQKCIYGDSGYADRWILEASFHGASLTAPQQAFKNAMLAVRISVEWFFKEVKMHFNAVDFKRKMKILELPCGNLFLTAMLLANYRNCIYPNQISRYFGCAPPSFEECATHGK